MIFICLMGVTGSGKSTVERNLEKLGFTRSISYTSRKPQVRNGKLEENGVEYNFVTREKFKQLVESGVIIEFEEYDGNLYGTPEPFGATEYVSVVCTNGFRALRQKYGEQVIGIYLKCSDEIIEQRALQRDSNDAQIKRRRERDNEAAAEMQQAADLTIDADQDINIITANILNGVKKLQEEWGMQS